MRNFGRRSSPGAFWRQLEAMRDRPVPPRPAHLHMTADELRARIDAMPPDKRDRLDAEAEKIHRQIARSRRWYRRNPQDVAAIVSVALGIGCIAVSPFIGDISYLTGAALLVITVVSWAIARHFRYRRGPRR